MWMTNVYATSLGQGLTALSSSVPTTASTEAAVTMEPAIAMRALLGKTAGTLPALKTATTMEGASMANASAILATVGKTALS